MSNWTSVLQLGPDQSITAGSEVALGDAIRRGADLRIYTEFRHNEHVDTASDNNELVQEVSDFPLTYLLDDRWTVGLMTFRMPISPPDGFGPRASMSFFMYNQDGRQAIARPFLDGAPAGGELGAAPLDDCADMPKYHPLDNWDVGTNAPSSNFIYDFETFRYFVWDRWEQVFSHTADGETTSGSLDALVSAFTAGREIKVAIGGLCGDLAEAGSAVEHEVFVQTGPGYYSTDRRLFSAGARPLVRVKPAIPMLYESRGWDFGWLMPRTDGLVACWLCDPYTLKFRKTQRRHAIRWFAG